MEKKKKKKIILSIALIALLIATAIFGTFFIAKKQNANSDNPPATNVSSKLDRINNAKIAITKRQKSQNYNGDYKFKIVGGVYFNPKLTLEQIINIAEKNYGTQSIDGIRTEITKEKTIEATQKQEIISFYNGQYTRKYKSSEKIVESGKYYGNDDLSEIEIIYKNSEFINFETYQPFSEMSLTLCQYDNVITPSVEDGNPTQTLLYVYRDIYNQSKTDILFTITYIYEMIDNSTPAIPDINFKY